MAVRSSSCGQAGSDAASGSTSVLDNNGFAESVAQALRDQPCLHVRSPSRRGSHDDGDCPAWIVDRARQRGNQQYQEHPDDPARGCAARGGSSFAGRPVGAPCDAQSDIGRPILGTGVAPVVHSHFGARFARKAFTPSAKLRCPASSTAAASSICNPSSKEPSSPCVMQRRIAASVEAGFRASANA